MQYIFYLQFSKFLPVFSGAFGYRSVSHLESIHNSFIVPLSTVQLRSNFTLTREQFTHTLEPFTRARIELFVASVLLPTRNSRKIIR